MIRSRVGIKHDTLFSGDIYHASLSTMQYRQSGVHI